MNELQRAEYLSALGVASYMPRFVLPLAPSPRQAELPVVRDVEAPNPGTRSPSPPRGEGLGRGGESGTSVESLVSEVRAAPKPKSEPVEKPTTAPPPTVKPFILSCWWLGEELLAVDSREPGAALPVESLFNNIARALNWHQLPREQDRLKWPLAENRFGPAASGSEARETCSAWLEAACARRPVKSIWLMGQQAQNFCASSPLEQAVSDWKGIRVIAMPSLSQLLREPQRKRDLWQLLRETYPEQTQVQ